MATARAAIGTILQHNGTSVALVSDIEGPGLKGDTIDTTNHDNADRYKEFIVGLKEGGDVKLKIFFDPLESTHTALLTAFEARTLDTYAIIPPVAGSPAWAILALVIAFDNKFKVNAAMEADVTLKVSGKPTFA